MRIFTDPHLGRNAGAHTSKQSSEALNEAIYHNAKMATKVTENGTSVVCVGDLFDKSHNRENILLQGLSIAKKCDLILAGNHDLANRENTKTSIEVIKAYFDSVVSARVNETLYEFYEEGGDESFEFAIIPHHSSQDLFDSAIEQTLTSNKSGDLIFLHCNFNSPFATNDSSLNLSIEQSEQLLNKFKYIVLGHEHNHRWELGGRLLILGNTHPTNFGDISDKFFWDYLPSTGFKKNKIWAKDKGYLKISVNELLDSGLSYSGQNFIEIVGEEVNPKHSTAIAKALHDIWHSGDAGLFMVRNNITFKQLISATVNKSVQLKDVTEAISNDLKETDLIELWETNLKGARND